MKFELFLKVFSRKHYRRRLILKTLSNFLILSALLVVFRIFSRPVFYEARYFFDNLLGVKYEVVAEEDRPVVRGGLSKVLKDRNIKLLVPPDENFSIVIPKIAAKAKVIPNVDATDEKAYLKALKKGVAHAAGTRFPGEGGHIYLFAHSTDYVWNVGTYNAVFYLLYKLEPGDEVYIFYKGKRYVYKVIGKKIVEPEQVEYLTRKTNKEFLTLQACWPPGTTLKRILVFAVRK